MMRKLVMLVVASVACNLAFGQLSVSVSGGYAVPSASQRLGTATNGDKVSANYGSYGEGANYQLRATYFFNETFGVDVGFGYLMGSSQDITSVKNMPNGMEVDITGKAKAFGLAPAVVYNFTDRLYGRFGALMKVGGKTQVDASMKATVPGSLINPALGNTPANVSVEATRDLHGVFPLGFAGAIGYHYPIGKRLMVFAELEYMGISVKRKDSKLAKLGGNVVVNGQEIKTFDMADATTLYHMMGAADPSLQALFAENIEYTDETTADKEGLLSSFAPYSSFGVNVGISFSLLK